MHPDNVEKRSFVGRVTRAINKRRTAIRHANVMFRDLVRIQREALRREVLSDPRYDDPKRLTRYAFKAFSQYGEDGMLAEILERVGEGNKTFVEIGTGDGTETNSTLLLLQGWKGKWIEGSAEDVHSAHSIAVHYPVEPIHAFVTVNNADQLVGPEDLSLLSIDIDSNDYWVWAAITNKPRVVIIEYNATIPPSVSATMAYNPKAVWDGSVYFGASLAALVKLGRKKGYSLVGCTLEGLNAFFVRDDLIQDKFLGPFTAENHYEPPRYWLGSPTGHEAGFGRWDLV